VFLLPDKWVWDFWLVNDGGLWHMFFLQAPSSLPEPDMRHWNVSIGKAQSHDLRNWKYQGEVFRPAPEPAWDDATTWTGSVVKDDAGLWHLFYTGTCKAEEGLKQRIGHATSSDMLNWTRCGDGPALDLDPTLYEEHTPERWHDRAMRDPWVMRHPDDGGWLMYFTARVSDTPETNAAGAIGLARSPDLATWELLPPVFAGGFGQLEVPQVTRIGDTWYCLFCTFGHHWSSSYQQTSTTQPVNGTHYLTAKSAFGPWHIAPGPFLDGTRPTAVRYAGKIIRSDTGLHYMAFHHDTPDGRFIGTISDPLPLHVTPSGTLRILDDQHDGRRAS